MGKIERPAAFNSRATQESAATMTRRKRHAKRMARGLSQPLQRLVELGDAAERVVTPLALLLHDLFGRALDEIGIAELGVDLGDIGLRPVAISLRRRARSAPMSMTPASGSAAVSPRTRSCDRMRGRARPRS